MKQKNQPLVHINIILALLLTVAILGNPVSAIKVEGAKIMMDVKPGTTYLFPMAVSIKPDDIATDVAIDILGFGQSVNGGLYEGLDAAADTYQYSARTIVSVEKPVIHLEPGQRVEFNAVIKLPSGASSGGRYALILVHPAAGASGQQTAFATAVAVPVMLTLVDGSLSETGDIISVRTGEIVSGKPIRITTEIKNTGNHHYYGVVNKVTVSDSLGNAVASVTTEPFARAIIPGQTVGFPADITTGIPVGTFTVMSRMERQDGTLLDQETASITVKDAFVPPFETTSLQVSPNNDAILAVPGGSITIRIPKGAFLEDGSVTVSPAAGTIPPAPSGAAAGTTAFVVEGVSGLLAKDATVTVKYAAGDLAAAGGDVKKLALARYDRGEAGWTILPTTADTNAKTLTTTTNRFSTWAVVAVQRGGATGLAPAATYSPGPDPLLACSILGLALLAWGGRRRS